MHGWKRVKGRLVILEAFFFFFFFFNFFFKLMNLNPLDSVHFYILSIHNKYVQQVILMSGFLEPKSFSILS